MRLRRRQGPQGPGGQGRGPATAERAASEAELRSTGVEDRHLDGAVRAGGAASTALTPSGTSWAQSSRPGSLVAARLSRGR